MLFKDIPKELFHIKVNIKKHKGGGRILRTTYFAIKSDSYIKKNPANLKDILISAFLRKNKKLIVPKPGGSKSAILSDPHFGVDFLTKFVKEFCRVKEKRTWVFKKIEVQNHHGW